MSKRSVVFLDFDGVVNDRPAWAEGPVFHLPQCARLQAILETTGAHIVLTTTWRHRIHDGAMTLAGFQRMLHAHDITAAKVDAALPPGPMSERWRQIQAYVAAHGVTSFVVLDDVAMPTDRLVRTDGHTGLADAHVRQAQELLKKSPSLDVACLCPTYRRPNRLVANAIACFEAQTYEHRRLIILDDGGALRPWSGDRWEVVTREPRRRSLPAKCNELADLAGECDVLVVSEDDDTYLPWHVEAHVAALEATGRGWSHPSTVLSTYTGKLDREGASGRFHAALAMRSDVFAEVGGWPDTDRADFDQQLLAELGRTGPGADPCALPAADLARPSYVFRWGSTGDEHGQSHMRGADDEGWYERAGRRPWAGGPPVLIGPMFDSETKAIYKEHGYGSS